MWNFIPCKLSSGCIYFLKKFNFPIAWSHHRKMTSQVKQMSAKSINSNAPWFHSLQEKYQHQIPVELAKKLQSLPSCPFLPAQYETTLGSWPRYAPPVENLFTWWISPATEEIQGWKKGQVSKLYRARFLQTVRKKVQRLNDPWCSNSLFWKPLFNELEIIKHGKKNILQQQTCSAPINNYQHHYQILNTPMIYLGFAFWVLLLHASILRLTSFSFETQKLVKVTHQIAER